jgi:hypothetical protein
MRRQCITIIGQGAAAANGNQSRKAQAPRRHGALARRVRFSRIVARSDGRPHHCRYHREDSERSNRERPMSIFGKIVSAIFGTKAEAAPPAANAAPSAAPAPTAATASPAAAPAQTVDVAAVLDKAVAAQKEKLEWRTSIVDLMKALNLDSSLAARKELAKELNYSGDTNDSATMNVWLHKQVIRKLAENGGKVPDDLKT